MKRKILSAFLCLAMFVPLMAGCSSSGTESTQKTSSSTESLTVAAVVAQEDQFCSFATAGMQAAAKQYNAKCITANCNNDQAKEVEYINTYLSSGVKGVAIMPLDQNTSVANLKKASKQGLAVALMNMDLTDKSFTVGGATTSHTELGSGSGKAAAEFIKNKLGGKANIGIVCFDSQYPVPSKQRVQGFVDEVKKVNPNVKIVSRQDAWVQDSAIQVAGDMLTAHPEINVFFCANDGGTVGTVMAVKNAGLAGKCFVFGIDGGRQQINMLRAEDNILQAVTAQDAYGMGYKTMESLIKYLQGNKSSVGKTEYLAGTVLNRNNSDSIKKYETLLNSVEKK